MNVENLPTVGLLFLLAACSSQTVQEPIQLSQGPHAISPEEDSPPPVPKEENPQKSSSPSSQAEPDLTVLQEPPDLPKTAPVLVSSPEERLSVSDFEVLLPQGDFPIASVEEKKIRASDLAAQLFFHFPPQAGELLQKLINDEIARREGRRYVVTVKASDLEAGVQEAIETLRKQVSLEYGGKRTLEEFLEQKLRTNLESYEKALRRFTLGRLFFERVLRYDQIREDRVVCRVITVLDLEKAEGLLGKLREGADFVALAKRESIAPNREQGGKLPPFGRGYDHPVTELAFKTPLGGLGGPVEEKRGEKTVYHLLRVIEKIPGRKGSYQDLEEEVRKGLEKLPIEEWEYFYWSKKMEKRYSVQLFDRP